MLLGRVQSPGNAGSRFEHQVVEKKVRPGGGAAAVLLVGSGGIWLLRKSVVGNKQRRSGSLDERSSVRFHVMLLEMRVILIRQRAFSQCFF
jgi:hypothetical protein